MSLMWPYTFSKRKCSHIHYWEHQTMTLWVHYYLLRWDWNLIFRSVCAEYEMRKWHEPTWSGSKYLKFKTYQPQWGIPICRTSNSKQIEMFIGRKANERESMPGYASSIQWVSSWSSGFNIAELDQCLPTTQSKSEY